MTPTDPMTRPQELDAIDQVEAAEVTTDPNDWPRMQAALEKLRVEHLPFRRAAPEAVRELEAMRASVTEKVTSDSTLTDYYEEAWNGIPVPVPPPMMALRRIVVVQLQLMESVFYTLQLRHYGNSPENAGWIDLFRRWGASPSFNRVFDEVDTTLTPDFVTFYLTYLRASLPRTTAERLWDEDRAREPLIHHPWLRRHTDRGRGAYMDSGLVEARLEFPAPSGAGGEIDPKGKPGVDQTYETPSADTDAARDRPKDSGNQ